MKRTTTACLCYLAMTMGASSLLANGGHGGGGHSGGHHGGGGGARPNGGMQHAGNQNHGGNQMRVQGSNAHVGNAVQHHKVQTNSPHQGHATHQHQGTQHVQNKPVVQHQNGQQTNQKVNLHNHGQANNQNRGQNNPLNQHHHNGHQNNNAGSFLGQHAKHHQGGNMTAGGKLRHNHTNGISHQHFTGNKVAFGKHHVNLSNASYQPSFYKHGNHYHGHWNWNQAANHHHHNHGWNNYGWPGYYNSGWGYQPYFWGVGGWGLGSMVYNSGYVNYYNPYYYSTPSTGYCYNYAQPIPVSYNTVVADAGTTTTPAASSSVMDNAVLAFQQNDFAKALDLTNQGIQQSPDDAVLHEFRGLVLFAKGDYQQAAATVHSILAVGPGWDWETLSGLYPDVGVYTNQLRSLEAFTKQNPQDAAGHFLLAYHYMSDGYPDAATRQLQQVKELVPNDMVASNLLKMTTASSAPADSAAPPAPTLATANGTQPAPATTAPPAPAPIDPSVIVGSWTASRDDGSNFGLVLKDDKTFSWSFSPKDQQAQSFDGTYKVEGNVIALERTGGGSLMAEIASNDRSKFNFKMVGSPDEDPGLTFIR